MGESENEASYRALHLRHSGGGRECIAAAVVDCIQAANRVSKTDADGSRIAGAAGQSSTKLEAFFTDCKTRYAAEVASARVQIVLAAEITGSSTQATDFGRNHCAHQTDGCWKSTLGHETYSCELLKLGIQVNKGTLRRYMWQARRKLPPRHSGQTWSTFLANHANEIWACDLVQSDDVFFRTIFLFFINEHHSRRVIHVGVTRSPNDAWVAQQIREATPFGEGPRFLLCDNDAKYGSCFEHAVNGANIEILHTPLCTPQANTICERFIGSVRHECLDFVLILSERPA
jgi:hypothetical protein